MWTEFKEFINKGSVLDLAVGVIIGAAFGKIVSSLTDDILMPFIGWITGGVDFSNKFILLGAPPAGVDPSDYAKLKEAGAAMLGYGSFITAIINFLIVAFVLFVVIKTINALHKKPAEPEAPAEPTTKVCPYCQSEISIKAVRCPHCTSKLEGFPEINN